MKWSLTTLSVGTFVFILLLLVHNASASVVNYTYSPTDRQVYSWAYMCGNSNGSSPATYDQPPPNDGPIPSCEEALAEFDSDGYNRINTSDDSKEQNFGGGFDYAWTIHYYNLSGLNNASNISFINFTWEGNEPSIQSDEIIYLYVYNGSGWEECGSTSSNSDTVLSCSIDPYENFDNYFNDSMYVHFVTHCTGDIGACDIKVDFVNLEVTYDEVIINSPINNSIFEDNYSFTLNTTSSSLYNNASWYSWNNGADNYTLCDPPGPCTENETEVTVPVTGVYNITVWGNSSDGAEYNTTVTNILLGNITYYNISLDNITDKYCNIANGCVNNTQLALAGNGVDSYKRNIYLLFNLSNLINKNITIHSADLILQQFINGGTSFNVPIQRITSDWNETDDSIPTSTSYSSYSPASSGNDTIDLTNLINSFVNSTYTNFGFMLNGTYGNGFDKQVRYNSSEAADPGRTPILQLIYYYPANTGPLLNITYTNGTNYTTFPFNITYNITDDDDAVDRSELYINGTLNQTDAFPTLDVNTNFSFDTGEIADGDYNFYIKVIDRLGAINTSATFWFTLDSTVPTYTGLTNNASSSKINEPVKWNVTLSDNNGIDSIKFAHNSTGTMTNVSTTSGSNDASVIANYTLTIELAYQNKICGIFWFNDTYGNENETSESCFTVANTLPTFNESLTDQILNHNQNLDYDSNCSDADNDTITYSINDTIVDIDSGNGSITDNPAQSDEGVYSLKVTCNDGTGTTNQTFNYSIVNAEPVVASASITPASPGDGDNLTCNNGSVSDTENDAVTLIYDWEKDSVWQGIDHQNLTPGNTSVGEQWRCSITPYDGYENGTVEYSQVVGIAVGFSAPTINYTNVTTADSGTNSTIANPTNNNTWLNFSVAYNDSNIDKWTMYVCNSSSFDSGCTDGTYCNSSINTTEYPFLSCRYDISNLPNSNYTYYLFVIDNESYVSSSTSGIFQVNHESTVPTIVTPTAGQYLSVNWALVNFTATDRDNDTINYTIYNSTDDATYFIANDTSQNWFNWTNLDDSIYYIKSYTYDTHSYSLLSNSTTYNFTIDTTNPSIDLDFPANATVNNSVTQTFKYTTTDTNLANCSLYADFTDEWALNQTNTSMTSGNQDEITLSLPEGSWIWNIRCYDLAGNNNYNSTNYSIIIDNTVPETISLNSPALDLYTSGQNIIFNWTAIDNVDSTMSCNLTINGTVNVSGISSTNNTNVNQTVNNFDEGYYLWNVTCEDDFPNVNTSTLRNFTVDLINPTLVLLSPTNDTTSVQTRSIQILYNESNLDFCNYTLRYDDTRTVASSGNFTCLTGETISTPSYEAGYLLEIMITDLAGRTNETSISFIVDTLPTSPTGGSSGGGGAGIEDIQEEVEKKFQAADICGNDICQSTENPWNCPQDCPFNADELLCFFGDRECKAWVFSWLFYLIVGTIIYLQYRKQRGIR